MVKLYDSDAAVVVDALRGALAWIEREGLYGVPAVAPWAYKASDDPASTALRGGELREVVWRLRHLADIITEELGGPDRLTAIRDRLRPS